MVRCKHCGAENYAIDMWCANCSQHLDWGPAAATVAAPQPNPVEPTTSQPAADELKPPPSVAEPAAQPVVAAASSEQRPEPQPEPKPEPIAVPVAAATITDTKGSAAPIPPVEREAAPRSRRKAPVWILPLAAAAVVAVLLAMPVLGWFKAAGSQNTAQLPLTGFNSSSPTATASPSPSATPDATPSPTDQPAAQPAAQPAQAQPPVPQQPAPVPAAQAGASDPRGSISGFYQAVAAHQFDAAAAIWSARMQSAYPPPQYINQRFAYTQQMNLRHAQVVANNGQTATVYIDLIEVYAGSTRHWVGTWQLVQTSSGWLLNQPDLRAAS